jgi:hypothetical protein
MRTTLDLDDSVLRQAKKRAAEEGSSLTSLIERAVRVYLQPARGTAKPFRLKLLTRRGRPVAGLDLDDRDALYERMEERG